MGTLIEQGQSVFLKNYKQFDIVFDHGKGSYLYDVDGKAYLDFVSGIAVNALGYSNETLKSAIHEQVDKFLHCSNLYWNEPAIEAAKNLVKISGLSKVFFCNSGTEAMEAALKLARKSQHAHGHPEKYKYVSMKNSFHGRTMASITVTGQEKYQKGLKPLLPGVSYGVFNDLESVKAMVDDETAAIIVEPVQGEGGIKPADLDFLQGLRSLCDEQGILLIFDEVQCGVGRTGTFFAYENYDVKPDIVCMAKGLGGGVPIGAIVVGEKAAKGFMPGDHAATFGGNPLATAAANVIIDTISEESFLASVREKGAYLTEQLEALVAEYPHMTGVRGIGLMQGIVFDESVDRLEIVSKAMAQGLLLVTAGKDVIRFVPPLTITKEEIDKGLAILKSVM